MESVDASTIISQIIENICTLASAENESNLEGLKRIDEEIIIDQTESIKAAESLECDDSKMIKEVGVKDEIESGSAGNNQSIESVKDSKDTESQTDQSTESIKGLKVIEEDMINEASGSDHIQSNLVGESQTTEVVEGPKDVHDKTINESGKEPIDLKSAGINQTTDVEKNSEQAESFSDEINQSTEFDEGLEVIDKCSGSDHIESNFDGESQPADAVEVLQEKPAGAVEVLQEKPAGAVEVLQEKPARDVEVLTEIGGKSINQTNANDPNDSKSAGISQFTEAVEEVKQSELCDNSIKEINPIDSTDSEAAEINKSIDAVEDLKQTKSYSDKPTESIQGRKIMDENIKDEIGGSDHIQSTEVFEGLENFVGKTIEEASANDPMDLESAGINKSTEDVEESTQITAYVVKEVQTTGAVIEVEGIDDGIIHEVDQGSFEEIKDLKIESTKSTDENASASAHPHDTKPITDSNDLDVQFFSSEILSSKGFSLNLYGKTRELRNLTLTGGQYTNCEIACERIPCEMIENELIPLFERAGQIYNLRIIKAVGKSYVTYTTPEDAENAVKMLHRRQLKGRRIFVERHYPQVRLFIKPIPNRATKQQIIDEIGRNVFGVVKIHLFDDPEEPGKNRGFCYAEFDSFQSAKFGKRVLQNTKVFGQSIICDWPDKEMTVNSVTMYIHNLRPSIQAKDLRKIFSVYGEVREIDKNGNFASILFRNAGDAMRAASEVDKTQLGSDNVEIVFTQFKHLQPIHRRSTYNTYNRTERDTREAAAARSPHKPKPPTFGPQRYDFPNPRGNITPSSHR